jgi:hypothetical protein
MSKLKSPQEKKEASLLNDCRNVYGENDKASRKRVPVGKQQGQQHLRRNVKEALNHISPQLSEDEIVAVEANALAREIKGNRERFKKKADAPLVGVLRERGEPYVPSWQGGNLWGPYRERFLKPKPKQ